MTETKRKLPLRSIFAVVLALVAALAAPCGAEAYQSVNKYVSNGHGYLNASYLVIHETANPGASAYNHTLLWSRDDTYAVHHVMELDGSTVYNTVPEKRLCWHVGNGNYATIGIELAHATNVSDFSKQWNEAVKWAGDELRAHGWDTSRLLSHYEAAQRWGGSDHTDPKDTTGIIARVATKLSELNRRSLPIWAAATWHPSHRPTATAARTSPPLLPLARVSRSPRARV